MREKPGSYTNPMSAAEATMLVHQQQQTWQPVLDEIAGKQKQEGRLTRRGTMLSSNLAANWPTSGVQISPMPFANRPDTLAKVAIQLIAGEDRHPLFAGFFDNFSMRRATTGELDPERDSPAIPFWPRLSAAPASISHAVGVCAFGRGRTTKRFLKQAYFPTSLEGLKPMLIAQSPRASPRTSRCAGRGCWSRSAPSTFGGGVRVGNFLLSGGSAGNN
jgi:hypothetical protein